MARLRAAVRRPHVSMVLRVVGIAVVLIGAIWAVASLGLTWSDLSLFHLALNLFLLTPALLVVAALSFKITALALGRDVSNSLAIHTVAAANVAELLPLPGGALVRGGALVKLGAGVGEATRAVLLTALLTLALTVMLSGVALGMLSNALWYWVAVGALAAVFVVLGLLGRHVAPRYLPAMVAVRLVTLLLTVCRLVAAFGALGADLGWIEATLYAVAPTLGTAVGIVPAGLGVNEAIAAGLATIIAGPAATAFLSVALNRALDLSVGAFWVLCFSTKRVLGGRKGS